MDVLARIKRLVIRGAVEFTRKAREEMELDGLEAADAAESIMNDSAISKTLASSSGARR